MGKIKRTEFQDLDGGQNAGDPNDSREKTMSLHLYNCRCECDSLCFQFHSHSFHTLNISEHFYSGDLPRAQLDLHSQTIYIIEGSLNRNFRQYGELKSR